ncbi:LytR C-terminal domain-containing protein [Actinoplanes sp. TRM 88003]|uniref:LytR C-terminal domain-containing protein n=1 Tax=Paractinoplanes aksuensis TaxID=2939490 RepID=A0ABT1DQ41_9ACTN|nr:LytR C-terminal domain-containing protein [Actinoplanes aksuensis]MCO8272942.1 LytR C-terminal domain-containing protein [Actinoplanes aksuensis]
MPRPVPERLRDLEAEIHDLRVLPAASVRARGRRRGRRQLAAVAVAGAVVATTAGVAFAWPRSSPSPAPVAAAPRLTCVLDLPGSPAEVQLRVYDGGVPTDRLAATVDGLRARTFTVLDGPAESIDMTTLRYGPASIGAAALVRAELHGDVALRYDPTRAGETIDVVLGPAFDRLSTPTETNANLVAGGPPLAPEGC